MQIQKDKEISEKAIAHARKTKKKFAKAETCKTQYLPEQFPTSILMAGSPGAGKTETVYELLNEVGLAIHIDPDKYRDCFEGYIGNNSHLFQGATSILVNKVIDLALKNSQSFILDGTLTNYAIAKSNIERALGRNYNVVILYVYQDPLVAWKFVQARERLEGRRIKKDVFIEQYFQARKVVNDLKRSFGSRIKLEILIKNITTDTNPRALKKYINGADSIDSHIPEKYNVAQLSEALNNEA